MLLEKILLLILLQKKEEGITKLITKMTLKENFIHSSAIELADYIIVVCELLTKRDQEYIYDIANQRKLKEGDSNFKEIFICHNLHAVVNSETDCLHEWETIGKLFSATPSGNSKYMISEIAGVQCRHFMLLNNEIPFGRKHNNEIIKLLHQWFQILVVHSNWSKHDENPWYPIETVFSKLAKKIFLKR